MPAGGPFSTAGDLARFAQMILNRGVSQGKRYLSEAAVAEMTRKQPGDAIKESDGLVWATDGGSIGHGAASATTMTIDLKRGLILVFLVRHAGFPGDGGKSLAAFKKAAEEQFGHSR
jgi:CubicO group peptidase (beta-lactamase class C family)